MTVLLLLALATGLALSSCSAASAVVSAVATRSLQQDPSPSCHIGCFVDAFPSDPTTRALKRWIYNDTVANSPEKCRAAAIQHGYNLFGLEWGQECWLSKAVKTTQATRYGPSNNCTYPCSGDSSVTCGGWFSLDLYTVGACPPPPTPPSPSPPPPTPSPPPPSPSPRPPSPRPPSPTPPSPSTSSCPAVAKYRSGLVQDVFKGKKLPAAYCPLGGSISGALGSDADWVPQDWNILGDYVRPHNTTVGIAAVSLTGASAPMCWVYNGYFRPTQSGVHRLTLTADDGIYIMMNLGQGTKLSALGAATYNSGVVSRLVLNACQFYQLRLTACNCQGPFQHALLIQGPSATAQGIPLSLNDPAAGVLVHTVDQEV